MIERSNFWLALGEVEVRAVDVRACFSEKRARALEAALQTTVRSLQRLEAHLDESSKRKAQQIHVESAVFLAELQEALRNQTRQNLAGVGHRAAAWLTLFRTTAGASPSTART